MRPEYIEAVEEVRTSWSFWLIYILPACVIWFSVLFRPLRSLRFQTIIICVAFILACYLYVECVWFHANRIQSAKETNMQTEEERLDWSGDVWRVFAPIAAIPSSLFYCTMNLVVAGMIRFFILGLHRINVTDQYKSENKKPMEPESPSLEEPVKE